MRIVVGHRQLMAMREAASERHLPYIQSAASSGKNRWAVSMPAAAWRALDGALTRRAFNKRGEWSSKHRSAGAAVRTISRNLLALEMHPAYEQRAVVEGEWIFPVVGFAGVEFSPYPPGALWVFDPDLVEAELDLGSGKVPVTIARWVPRRPDPSDVLLGLFVDPAEHEGWVDSAVPAGAER